MTPQEMVGLALKVSILRLTVFGFGLQATRDDLLYVRRPGLMARSLVAMFVIMPLVAIAFRYPSSISSFQSLIALIALSISPVPPLLPRKIREGGGVAPYGLGLMVTADPTDFDIPLLSA